MHIPDGYLSPATCAALYAGSAPFWYVSLQRVKAALHTRLVPLLSLFAAFSFVIMMFNLPLPGGTSGHAVGIGLAAVVLGPWASMIAISIALIIQAFFFGDGGITAIGANCFNMAIAGSLVAHAVYRLVAGRAALTASRRVIAAGLGGYFAINVAAFLAAVEFGIQPMLYRDATGAPLYCPYPLSISIPAMMLGHLTVAGMAEFVVSAGVVAFLQRTDVSLLRASAGAVVEGPGGLGSLRPIWAVLALLLLLTPLGILAGGTAWGEWVASDFSNPATRAQIGAASRGQAPPAETPAGLERLGSIWTAPFAQYAPPYVRSSAFGYVLSAMFGTGLVLLDRTRHRTADARKRQRMRGGFVEHTIEKLYSAMERALYAETVAGGGGLLQSIDPRVKVAGLLALILAADLAARLSVIAAILAFAIALAGLSRISIATLAGSVWVGAFTFTGALAIPALFLTPGDPVGHLPLLGWTITAQGIRTAAYLVLRVEAAATLGVLLVFTTPWAHVLKALRAIRAPVVFVVILGMTCRYILVMLEAAHEMFESRQSRTVGDPTPAERRRMAVSSIGVLLGKTFQLSSEVYLAMQSRGFRGEVYVLDDFRMRARDWTALALFVALFAAAVWAGR